MVGTKNLLQRNGSFRKVWLGQVLSQGGSKAYLINLLWWVIGHSPTPALASGTLLVLTALPSIFLVKVIGRVLGRYPSQRILVMAEAAGAVLISIVLFLLTTDLLTFPILCAVSVLIATCQAVVDPTLIKAVGELVDPDDVDGAVAFEASTQSLAYFVGTAVGATVTGLLGLQAAVLLNIVSYAISAALTATAEFRPFALGGSDGEAGAKSFDLSAVAGVRVLLYAFAAANFLLFPLFLVLPLFTLEVLNSSVVTLGMIEGCFWLGLIAGASASRFFSEGRGLAPLVGKLLMFFGLALFTVFLLPNAVWTGGIFLLGGVTVGVVNVKVLRYFQGAVPNELKGDFFVRMQAFVAAAQPLGYLAFTFVLTRLPIRVAFAVDGAGLVLIGLATWILSRQASRPYP